MLWLLATVISIKCSKPETSDGYSSNRAAQRRHFSILRFVNDLKSAETVLDCRFHDKDASGSALLETNLSGSRWRGEM